jgi:hypothetical protein
MKLTNHKGLRASGMMGLLLIELFLMGLGSVAHSQAFSTTTVQGTVYLANGQAGTGTLVVSWPSFTTASGQVVAADSMTLAIAPDGFVSVNLAANQGTTPAGLYYTAIFYLSDGSVNTQYWVVPAATSATLAQVQARLMPSTQAVQAVSKTYVDQAIATLTGSALTASGGTLSGPLTLCCDPATPLQAANKRYVDAASAQAVPLTGGTLTGPLTATKLGAVYQVDQFAGADFGAKLGACLSGLNLTNGGTCDARNFTGTLSMGSNLVISTANATVLLPCATISTANRVMVTAGTRNVTLRGCALRGASTASGSQGGTVFYYSGTGAMVQVGDPTYAADTLGFHLDNAVVNITAATSASAQGFAAYRTQELDLESLYFLGNQNQTGMMLDGTGNYTGGMFYDNEFTGFQTAVNAIGHQITNAATTDWVNASTFVRLHIDCPTSGGSPISGTFGINLQQGDGNTFTGGDVEGCSTALHLGANAQNNTIVGLRNENSANQVVADAGSSYNDWITGGTMFAGKLTDNGTRNSFLDTFHRSFNGLNGDWYGSQTDATVTNHYRLGTGAGNERGLLNRYQSDFGYRWTMGLSDATAGEQFYQVLDELNNVYRVSVGQYNNGQSSTNNQTVINAAGTGAVVLNGSNNAGTGGVVIGSGGASVTTVATINNAGNAQFNGTLQVGGASTLLGSATMKNQADAEIDATLWAGLTASQKESFIYKDWNGNSQWYMVKDGSNNWAVNSATGGLDSFKAYQSTNSGDTYINTSNSTGVVRINYETGSGTQFKVYGGNSSTLYASFTGTTSIQFPGIAASSGHNCLQVDNSGYVTNTGTACGTGSGNGTVNTGSSGQIAYYNGAGTALSGLSAVSVTAGGTGATTAAGALANLGGVGSFTYAGTSAPSATCSALVNNGYIATNATPQAYQCSSATGSYAWNTLGGGNYQVSLGATQTGSGSTGMATFPGTVAAGTRVTSPQIGTVYNASQFPGADLSAQINNCAIAANAANTSVNVCDARDLHAGGSAGTPLAEQINWGRHNLANITSVPSSSTCTYATHGDWIENTASSLWYQCDPVGTWAQRTYPSGVTGEILLLPTFGIWYFGFTDGTSYGISQGGESQIVGESTGGGGNSMYIVPAGSGTSMAALYGTDPSCVGNSCYMSASGFAVVNFNPVTGAPIGATFAHGVFYVNGIFDESHWERIYAQNPTGDAGHLATICCGSTFNLMQFDSAYGAGGGTPLTLDTTVSAQISNSSINAAGTGHHNLLIGAGNYMNTFINDYIETGGSGGDTTTSVVGLANDGPSAQNIFIGGGTNLTSGKACFSPTPSTGLVNEGFCGLSNFTSNAVFNRTLAGNENSSVGSPAYLSFARQDMAGGSSFTPAANDTGHWYRIYSTTYANLSLMGWLNIATDRAESYDLRFSCAGYGTPCQLSWFGATNLYGFASPQIQKVEIDGDGSGGNLFIDVYVVTGATPVQISYVFHGQSNINANSILSPTTTSSPSTPPTNGAVIADFTQSATAAWYPIQAWSGSIYPAGGFNTDLAGHIVTLPSGTSGVVALTSQIPSVAGNFVGTGQANTYTTGLQNFSAASMKLPTSVTVGGNTINEPSSAGTYALTSQIPSVVQQPNLILYPADLTNAAWPAVGGTATNPYTFNVTASGGNNLKQTVAVTPGANYTFSFLAKLGTLTTPMYRVYDQTHGADIVAATSYATQINATTWTSVVVPFTVPAGCTSVAVYVSSNSTGTGTVLATNVSITQ